MFPNSVCPVCGRSATSSCTGCGLKAHAFNQAVHAGTGVLAVAWTAIVAIGSEWTKAPEIARVRHAAAQREWVRTEVGSLALFLRERRPRGQAQEMMSEYEIRVHAFGRDAFFSEELCHLTPERLEAKVSRFMEVASEAARQGWKPLSAQPVGPATKVGDERRDQTEPEDAQMGAKLRKPRGRRKPTQPTASPTPTAAPVVEN